MDSIPQEIEDIRAQIEVYREEALVALEQGEYRTLCELAIDMTELASSLLILMQFTEEPQRDDDESEPERVY